MDLAIPTVFQTDDAQIDDPDVGQAGGNHQAFWITDMALVEMEATTFLVGKESFDPHLFAISEASFLHDGQIGDQIDGVLIAFPLPENDHDRSIGLPCEQDIV